MTLKKGIMFHKNLKLVITVLLISTAVWQFTESNIGNGIMFILLASIFVFLYFKNEIILLAFLRLRKQDFPGAKKWLDRIKNPEASLVTKQQGYFNYLNGLMISQSNMNEAEKYFKKAVALGLSMDTDMAMTKLNLAGIAMSKNRKREAEALLSEAKKLDKQNMMEDQIKMMKDQMKRSGQPKQQYGGGRSSRGNKR
ncbi:MAG: tetratricopeptide (TPR) repeat protein [Flavobacteriales bacterium]